MVKEFSKASRHRDVRNLRASHNLQVFHSLRVSPFLVLLVQARRTLAYLVELRRVRVEEEKHGRLDNLAYELEHAQVYVLGRMH